MKNLKNEKVVIVDIRTPAEFAGTDLRGNKRGSFSIAFHNGFINPSLFHGAAGVGYQMLRLADPSKVPSVLLLN